MEGPAYLISLTVVYQATFCDSGASRPRQRSTALRGTKDYEQKIRNVSYWHSHPSEPRQRPTPCICLVWSWHSASSETQGPKISPQGSAIYCISASKMFLPSPSWLLRTTSSYNESRKNNFALCFFCWLMERQT